MKLIKNILTGIAGFLFFGALIFFASEVTTAPPSNAVVVLNHNKQELLAPPCLNPNFKYEEYPEFELSTLEKARKLGYESDNCSEHALWPSQSTFTNYVLVPLKIVKPLKRWDENGNWTH